VWGKGNHKINAQPPPRPVFQKRFSHRQAKFWRRVWGEEKIFPACCPAKRDLGWEAFLKEICEAPVAERSSLWGRQIYQSQQKLNPFYPVRNFPEIQM